MKQQTYKVIGMSCAACVQAIEKILKAAPGVKDANINLVKEELNIEFDESVTNFKELKKLVKQIGYDLSNTKTVIRDDNLIPLIISIVLSIPLLYIAMAHMQSIVKLPLPGIIDNHNYPLNFALIQLLLAIPVVVVNIHFFTKGFKALIKKVPNMDTLIAIGTGSAFLYSLFSTINIWMGNTSYTEVLYYESAAIILTLVSLGKYLEHKSKARTTEAIKKLIHLTPPTAIVLKNNQEVEVNVSDLKVGDICIVKPGSKIPGDGKLTSGSSYVDESLITGESMPIQKQINDQVIGGSMNGNGLMHIKITAIGKDSVLAKIISLVEEASSKKAPIAKLADKISGYFVPVVMVIAIITSIIWLLAGKDFVFALTIFVSILVIACPCALGLATPVAIITGTGKGAENGILIKSGEALELMNKSKVIILDKTGTITEGKPTVTDIISHGLTKQDVLYYAALAEQGSEHPLAKAILEEASKLRLKPLKEFKAIPGFGIIALIDKQKIIVGNLKMLEKENIKIEQTDKQTDLSKSGKTVVYIALNNKYIGLIAVADPVKPTSIEAIKMLHQKHLKVVMLTGDNQLTADAIAKAVGIDEVIANVLPQDKFSAVKKYQVDHKVIMVGDGINDAPALVQADVGIAIGTGTDIAVESADVVLMRGDLKDVVAAITLSRYTITNIKQNLFWAFIYNILGIPIAAGLLYIFGGPLLNPIIAGGAMAFSSISVVLNALRLKTIKIKGEER